MPEPAEGLVTRVIGDSSFEIGLIGGGKADIGTRFNVLGDQDKVVAQIKVIQCDDSRIIAHRFQQIVPDNDATRAMTGVAAGTAAGTVIAGGIGTVVGGIIGNVLAQSYKKSPKGIRRGMRVVEVLGDETPGPTDSSSV